jgi:GT2 family glycosyltransferase
MPPVTLIIVAWNQLEKTLACLESLAALDYPETAVLLVDNGSTPPLAEPVQARFPAVRVLRLESNTGFAGGYNAGLRQAMTEDVDLVMLLNNDTLVAPDALGHLVAEAESAPGIGLVTAKIYYAADPQRIWTVGNNLNVFLDITDGGDKQLDTGQWSAARDVDFAPFCGILIKREVIETVGYLDEGFFLYYEDMDYCRRARQAGYRIRLQPDAHIWHDVSASTGGQESPLKRYWIAQSSGRYFRKHGRGARMSAIIPFRAASALKMSVALARRGRTEALRAYWAGLRRGWTSDEATAPPPEWLTQTDPTQRS